MPDNTMLERIRQILTARALSPTQFADVIGVGRPVISHVLSGRNKPSLEVIQKIVDTFPELSLSWLLKGEGPMLAVAQVTASPPDSTEAISVPVADTPRKKQRAAASSTIKFASEAKRPIDAPVASGLVTPAPANASAAAAPATVLQSGTTLPAALTATPVGKAIRRIIIFYQDGTFTDYQPEAEG